MVGESASTNDEPAAWDTGYEYRVVALMAVGFGLVGLDRYIIFPLFPVIAEDLGLTYGDLGLISAALALTWGIASFFSGNLSDRFGAKRVIIVSVILFSALVAFTGLATGLISFLILRSLMGVAEGGFVPASIIQTIRSSRPERVGLNFGLQQMASPLFGLFVGPLLAVGLLVVLPGWEWVFAVIALPGFLVAFLVSKMVRSESDPQRLEQQTKKPEFRSFLTPLRYHNVWVGAAALICVFVCVNTLSTFGPNYLTDFIGAPLAQMGAVMSFVGFGGLVGMIVLPAASDRFGRKPVSVVALTILVGALIAFFALGDEVSLPVLVAIMFVSSFMSAGTIAILVGPVISGSVPVAIGASATGIVVGLGEVFGGAGGPVFAGFVADTYGIRFIPVIMIASALLCLAIVALWLREPDGASSYQSR